MESHPHCHVCHQPITPFFSLGKLPIVNNYRRHRSRLQPTYLLELGFCANCCLVQLTKTVPPSLLFRHYLYFSSDNPFLRSYNKQVAQELTKRLQLKKNSLVIELASNDGVLLRCFQQVGIPVLGIDPAVNVAQQANANGIPTLPVFFTQRVGKELRNQGKQADLVYGANVLAHVPKVLPFLKGVKSILKPNGTAMFEFPYLLGLFEGKFDTIYHEHVYYYSAHAIQRLAQKAGLELVDIQHQSTQGGSLRVYLRHPDQQFPSTALQALLQREVEQGWTTFSTYITIRRTAESIKEQLTQLLIQKKAQGMSIVGYGAAAKAVVLINYLQVGNLLDYVVDDSPAKQGRYIPGTDVPIVSSSIMQKNSPQVILLFAWNIAQDLLQTPQLRQAINSGAEVYVPIPKVQRCR